MDKQKFYKELAELMLKYNVWISYDYETGWAFSNAETYDENLAVSMKALADIKKGDSADEALAKLQAFVSNVETL